MAEKDIIKDVNEAVANYSGQVAKWKSSGYKGKLPKDVLVALGDLYVVVEKFLASSKGN